ncbi:MAG TPA: ParA family protein, partial [Egibacteraceae bacterium]|nr:ParA family protein [Egibacteraceae bacterium]
GGDAGALAEDLPGGAASDPPEEAEAAEAAPAAPGEPGPAPEQSPPGAPPPFRFARARVLTIANQKGGVGKTTTAVSVSAALADLGCRVLLVDLDPQGNATSGVGIRVPPNRPTIYEVLVSGIDIDDAIEPTSVRNLFVVPSNLDLAGAEIELVSAFNREQKLRRALEPIRLEFDVVVIDCPPSLGLLTVNALTAGDGLIVPIQCEYYALEGLGALRRNADLIRSQLNPDLDVTGFVLTMLDARTRLSQQVVEEVRGHFGERVFTTRIPRSVRLAEAPGFGQPITVFDPTSRGAMAYRRLAKELLERLQSDERDPEAPRTEGARL